MKSDSNFASSVLTGVTSVKEWLIAFADAVRSRDFEKGRLLFAKDDAVPFPRAASAVGLEVTLKDQWFKSSTFSGSSFTFDLEALYGGGHDGREGDIAWAAVPWQSEAKSPEGKSISTTGRATFVLRRTATGWLAIQSQPALTATPKIVKAAA